MKRAGLSLFSLLLATPFVVMPVAAQSELPPNYDAEAHCKEVASSYSAFMDNACLAQEQSAYDGLKAAWANLPADAREHCDEVARFGGKGTYFMLKACIDQEMQARGSRPKFRH